MVAHARMVSAWCEVVGVQCALCFFFSSRRRHTRCLSDWSSDVCSSDLVGKNSPMRCGDPCSPRTGRCWGCGSILFTDGRYRTQAKEEIKNAHVKNVSM